MFIRVLDCISTDHNPTLVVVAIVVALFSGFALFTILDHARARHGRTKIVWIFVAAFTAGGGIWSTHFIAMLGFQPAAVVSYDVGLTVVSAFFAVALAGTAMPLLLSRNPVNALAGSLLLSAAIGVMHFIGMRALLFAGTFEWHLPLVALSLCAGCLLVIAATFAERRRASVGFRLAAGSLFGAAICTLHFTAMSAAILKTDPSLLVQDGNLSEFLLGISVAVVTALIVIFSLVTVMFDRRAHDATTDAQQMRCILEAAQIGILVCQDDEIVSANKAFERLVGCEGSSIEGRAVADFFEPPARANRREPRPYETEGQLKTANGMRMDVALNTTPIVSGDTLRHLVEVRDIGDHKRARDRLDHLANHDELTGLPNRRLLNAELRQEALSSQEFGLMWMDLDRFKEVNDTHGHAIGDALLQAVAQRFRSVLDERHLLARVGGDEFVVLFRHSSRQSDLASAAESLLKAMVNPVVVESQMLEVGVSIGLARYPQDAESTDALMRRADLALYEAKKTGRSRYAPAA
jgi:diguanylate cyclase (GGDEF)-like protein/PAS domain S-box-containing protein